MCPTGVATWMNFSGVFLQKCISSPKYRSRECRWRGCHKMPDQSKPPLKFDQSCWNFHRKLSLCQRMNLYWSGPLDSHIKNFISGVLGPPGLPSWVKYQVYHSITILMVQNNYQYSILWFFCWRYLLPKSFWLYHFLNILDHIVAVCLYFYTCCYKLDLNHWPQRSKSSDPFDKSENHMCAESFVRSTWIVGIIMLLGSLWVTVISPG